MAVSIFKDGKRKTRQINEISCEFDPCINQFSVICCKCRYPMSFMKPSYFKIKMWDLIVPNKNQKGLMTKLLSFQTINYGVRGVSASHQHKYII